MTENKIRTNEIEGFLRELARGVDYTIKQVFGKMGFMIVLFEFGKPGVSNYISNAERADMITAMRETADRLEKNQDIPAAHPTVQ